MFAALLDQFRAFWESLGPNATGIGIGVCVVGLVVVLAILVARTDAQDTAARHRRLVPSTPDPVSDARPFDLISPQGPDTPRQSPVSQQIEPSEEGVDSTRETLRMPRERVLNSFTETEDLKRRFEQEHLEALAQIKQAHAMADSWRTRSSSAPDSAKLLGIEAERMLQQAEDFFHDHDGAQWHLIGQQFSEAGDMFLAAIGHCATATEFDRPVRDTSHDLGQPET